MGQILKESREQQSYSNREMIAGPYGVQLEEEWWRMDIPSDPDHVRTDIYGNEYRKSDGVIEVVPEADDFDQYLGTVTAFANNFYTLFNNGINVPDFEAGVKVEENSASPYFLMADIEGEPGDQSVSEEVGQKLADVNQIGKTLGENREILYTRPFPAEDFLIVNQNSEAPTEVVVRCPGTYDEELFEDQINDSDLNISMKEIEKMKDEEFWK